MGAHNDSDAGSRPGPSDWDAATYDRIADPVTRSGTAVLDRLPPAGDEGVLDAGCGSGRVTERLCERLPRGRIVALDLSATMLTEARRRLARFADRVTLVRADLARPLPVRPVDAVFSTATFHWIQDHDALFAGLAGVLRPGGRLVAQCGGTGNIGRVQAAARAAGLADVQCWLQAELTPLAPGEPLETYLRTVCLRRHLEVLPPDAREPFVREVARCLGAPVIDYVSPEPSRPPGVSPSAQEPLPLSGAHDPKRPSLPRA